MKLENIIQKTGIVNESMTIKDGFAECVKNNIPAVPYLDPAGNISGSFAIREVLIATCIPHVMVRYADLLGDETSCMKIIEQHAIKLLKLPAKSFVDNQVITIAPGSTVSKAIALMEKHSVNYLFVVDRGEYIGLVTIDGIASRLLQLDEPENGQA